MNMINKPKNSNYAAVVVEITKLIPLENCDNVQAAIIMGNQVIVSKNTKEGDIGLYFPLETQLSEKYLSANNLYRKLELNSDSEKKGYFEENGRIRCVKFRGNKSEGLFMPLNSINNVLEGVDNDIDLKIGDEFDKLQGIEICRKYIPKHTKTPGTPGSRNSKKMKAKYKSKLVENQFRFHQETGMLYKNLHMIHPEDLISITYKMHGTSAISSKILCRKQLKWYEKILRKLGFNIINIQYDYIYSSRKIVKNETLNPTPNHFYSEDIWKITHEELKEFLQDGMTFYYEVVGFLPEGGAIQKDYDYNCEPSTHKIYIYRITYTNVSGKVFEFSAKQVQDFCKKNGLNAVPQVYYGFAKGLVTNSGVQCHVWDTEEALNLWRDDFLTYIKTTFNEHDCYICKNKVPEEGVVIRKEGLDFEAYKAKSNLFYERETKLFDTGESNIEDEN